MEETFGNREGFEFGHNQWMIVEDMKGKNRLHKMGEKWLKGLGSNYINNTNVIIWKEI